ncbi:Transposase IS4 [Popillia japonica]|uniref:Transposase IS4 n=1 Tax=Popillia japonica TaxID=7064 RepID=A0AAW1I9K5_POPJA
MPLKEKLQLLFSKKQKHVDPTSQQTEKVAVNDEPLKEGENDIEVTTSEEAVAEDGIPTSSSAKLEMDVKRQQRDTKKPAYLRDYVYLAECDAPDSYAMKTNEAENHGDRLYKIKALIDALNIRYKELKTPSEVVIIDESMVPFRGRLLFKQYIPGKASKYGVKIFKICDESGYTYNTEVYKDAGRTLVADNYYNNIELTKILLTRRTHVVGTLRKFVKSAPKEILNEKDNRWIYGAISGKASV